MIHPFLKYDIVVSTLLLFLSSLGLPLSPQPFPLTTSPFSWLPSCALPFKKKEFFGEVGPHHGGSRGAKETL